MNGITVSINDKTKRAVCKETVALCAQYHINVEPALEGDGFLVLHRRHVGSGAPDGKTVFVGGEVAASPVYNWDMNEVYAVVNLTTTTNLSGQRATTGTLDLRYQNLCRDLIQRFGTGAEASVVFAVYDTVAGGLAGDGEFNVKVVEPYYVSDDQNLALFRGEKGSSVQNIELIGSDAVGNYVYKFSFTDDKFFFVTMPRGPMGNSSAGSYAYNQVTHKYHILKVVTNGLGQLTVKVDPEGVDTPPSDAAFVTIGDVQTIIGKKTFTSQIEAQGGVAGDVVGDVTGDVTGSVDATGEDDEIDAKTKPAGTSDSKVATTEFVERAVSPERSQLFDIRISVEDMSEKSGGVWVALPNSSGDAKRRLAKTSYQALYDELMARYNANVRVSTGYRIYNGVLFNTETAIDHSQYSDYGNPIILANGQLLTVDDTVIPNAAQGEQWGVRVRINANGTTWNDTTFRGLMSARESWHYKGEQYVDSSGNVKQYLADTLYAAADYDDAILPRYLCPSVEISKSYVRAYAAYENGTSFNMYNGSNVSHGLNLNNYPDDDWIVTFGVDGTGFYFRVESANRDYSSGRKSFGTAKPQLMGEKILGNSVAGGNYSRPVPKIYAAGTATSFEGSTYFDGQNENVYTTENHFLTAEKNTYGRIVLASSDNIVASSRMFKLTPNYVILPYTSKKYFNETGLEAVFNMRVKP